MKVFLFQDYLNSIHGSSLDDSQAVCEIELITSFPNGLSRINGKLCRVCTIDSAKERIYIEHVSEPIGEERVSFSSEITCPHCGHEESDSWECSDSEDDRECGVCGSIFSYQREIEVTYTSKIIERNEIIVDLVKTGDKND